MIDHTPSALSHAVRLCSANALACLDCCSANYIRDQNDSLAANANYHYIALRGPHLTTSEMAELGQILAHTPHPLQRALILAFSPSNSMAGQP
jgi:hypothetical protein